LDEAGAAYRHAIKVTPDHPDAHLNMGIILHEQGKFSEAVVSLKAAMCLAPKLPKAHARLGVT
jgi:Tfp pilus assembly protein PilF